MLHSHAKALQNQMNAIHSGIRVSPSTHVDSCW